MEDPTRHELAIYEASACGEPETSPHCNSKEAAWGELEEDYAPQPEQTDVKFSTIEEVHEFYDQRCSEDIKLT